MRTRMVGPTVVTVLALCLLGTGCGDGGVAGTTPPSEGSSISPPPPGQPLGEEPPIVAEPDPAPDLGTPEKTLIALLDGRAREDVAFLARCESVTAEMPTIDALDTARAWRYYCRPAMQAKWSGIENAYESEKFRFTESGNEAVATFDVGGAAVSTEVLYFIKIAGKWYIRYSGE
ncbi:MAG: hypothetical protein O6952_09830 [Planctomycetota bacterium]|nr:hypothetical protein [Planctomycetota bacterium]